MIYKINKEAILEGNVFGGLVGAAALGSAAALGAGSLYGSNYAEDAGHQAGTLKREGDFAGSEEVEKKFINGLKNSVYGAAAVGATAGGLMGYNSKLKQNTPRN